MQETLHAIIEELRVFLYGGLRSLPFTLGGTMLTIGLFTSNYAVLFFLIGFLVITPLGSWIVNRIIPIIFNCILYVGSFITRGWITKPTGSFIDIPYFMVKPDDICKLIIPFGTNSSSGPETVISSEWMAMMAFFIGYILCNALELYNNNEISSASLNVPDAPDTQMKINKRKSQAMFAIVSIAIFAVIIFAFRGITGCETFTSVLITIPLFGVIGYYWYQLLSEVGQGRLSDIFGIANRLLVPSALKNSPIACVPLPAP